MSLPSKRIALYVGDELYPANGVIQTATIQELQSSALTSPILGLLNNDGGNTLVYNDPQYPMFDATGTYIGADNWPQTVAQLRNKQITEVYISFSTSGTDWMAGLSSTAMTSIFTWLKNTLGVDGVDFDYEGTDLSPTSNMYPVAKAAVQAGLKITAAPFGNSNDWQAWVTYLQGLGGTVSWLNVQCYSGGGGNNPGEWLFIGVPIVAGSCPNCVGLSTCTPAEIEKLYMYWRTGYGGPSNNCWSGDPNPSSPQLISGGFFWAYSSIKNNNFREYMNAMKVGLEGVL